MRKYLLDYFYLLLLGLLLSYIVFKFILNSQHIIQISMHSYLGIGFVASTIAYKIRLKFKKENVNTIPFLFISMFAIFILYLFLFDYYDYDFLHEKKAWQFWSVFIVLIAGELINRNSTYEELKKEQETSFFSIFKKRNK